jgi:outer membrane protein OmpA-like peptidoglycan-associated protein
MTRPRALLLVVTVAAAGTARADQGIDAQIFKPALDPFGVFSVERARGLAQWDYSLKLMASYAQAPLRLAVENVGDPGQPSNVIDSAMTFDFGVSFGLTDRLSLAFDVPLSRQPLGPGYGAHGIYMPVDPNDEMRFRPGTGFYSMRPDQNVEPSETPPGDVRVGLKLRLTGRGSDLALAAQLLAWVPFGDEDVFAGSEGFTLEPKLILEKRLGLRGFVAVNAGLRLREGTLAETRHVSPDGFVRNDPTTHQPIYEPLLYVGTEAEAAVGARFALSNVLGIGGEAYGLVPIATSSACTGTCKNGDLTAEALAGLFVQLGADTTLSIAGGLALIPDSARGDQFRGLVGLAWTPTATGGLSSRRDRDGDGIPDDEDLCPDEPEDFDGFQDADGCPDPDNDLDGIPDKLDKCPNDPEDKDGYQDADGCPDTDDDHDGIPDLQDKCPHEPEDFDGFQDADGCPDPDNDGDGILDKDDKCPNEPETVNGVEDADGCPDQAVQGGPRLAADRIDLQGERVEFLRGTARFTPQSLATLDQVAAVVLQNPTVRIRVEVGVERSGVDRRSRDADMKLTVDRARAIQALLTGKGVKPVQLDIAPLGSDRPIDAKNPKDPRLNRRVEFIRVTQ